MSKRVLAIASLALLAGLGMACEDAADIACSYMGSKAPSKMICQINEGRKAIKFVTRDLELKTMHRYGAPYDWVKDHCRVLNLGPDKTWAADPDVEQYGSYGYPQNYYAMVCDR